MIRYGARLVPHPTMPGLYVVDEPGYPADPGLYILGEYYQAPNDLSLVGFSWGGIEFTQWGPYYITAFSGWSAPPDASSESQPVPGRHGSWPGLMRRSERVVRVEGFCPFEEERDALFLALDDAMAQGFGDGDEVLPLIGSVAGRTLTADAQLQRWEPVVEKGSWPRGVFGWSVQWRCPDPMRYGADLRVDVPIRVQTLGITFPVTGDWVFPADPVGGQAQVNNSGNALADAVYTLRGPLDGAGVALVEPGKSVRVDFDLADGDELIIDTAAGLITLNGEYRPPSIDSAMLDEMRLPRSTTTTVQALGTPQAGSPLLSVWTQPTYW